METQKVLDPKKLKAAMDAAGITEAELARKMTQLAGGKRRWSAQNVTGWTRSDGGYAPHRNVTPYIQAALGIADFGEIASPVGWPADLPMPEKTKKTKKGD